MSRIYELRKSKLLTQKQLANMLSIDQTSVSHWERGKGSPDIVNLIRLANIFDVSLDYLAGRDEKRDFAEIKNEKEFDGVIEYAVSKGLTLDDISQLVIFIVKIKEK